MYLLLILLMLVAYIFLCKKYSYWKTRNVPYIKPTFITGNIGGVLTLKLSMSDICKKLYSDFRDYRYVGFYNMWTPAILVRDPEIIKDIIIKQFDKYRNWFQIEDSVDPVLSLNPFVTHGPKWKSIRSVLTSEFTSAKIKSMMPNIQVVNDNMMSFIKKEINFSKGIEVRQLTKRFAGDSVMLSAFGLDGKSFEGYISDSSKIAQQFSSKSKFVQLKQTLSIFFPNFRKIVKATFLGDPVSETFGNIIKDTLRYRRQNKITRNDYLSHLNDAKTKLLPYYTSDNDLVAHAFTFFLNGFETSSIAFAYALFELSQNKHVQMKAQSEISAVLSKYDQNLSYEALQEIEYIEYIVLETLRKYPIIKLLARVNLDDVVFPSPYTNDEGKNVIIEKGTEIFISNEGMHYDSEYYIKPELFNPDRFKEDNKKFTFFGFGDGPRMCLGRSFALTQIKLGLIAILSEFNLEINKKTDIPLDQETLHTFLSPKSDIWLDFIPRT